MIASEYISSLPCEKFGISIETSLYPRRPICTVMHLGWYLNDNDHVLPSFHEIYELVTRKLGYEFPCSTYDEIYLFNGPLTAKSFSIAWLKEKGL